MKRFLKGLTLAFAAVLGLTLAACGEKTETPVTPTPETPEHQHALVEGWKRDSAVHWQECSSCDELVNMAAHDYADWVKDAEKCQQTRDCKVCGYRETQSVDHSWNAEGTCTHCGEALVITQYYVRGSFIDSTWPALDEYKLPIDYNTRTAEITVSLTAGDEFKVADANWSAEFNINTIVCEEGLFDGTNNIIVKTTADYKIVLSKLETSTPVCTITQLCVHEYGEWTLVTGKTCEYQAACTKCQVVSTKTEHAGYGEWTLVEGKTCDFEQVCACGDKKTKVEHTWGDDIVCDKCQAVNVLQFYVRGDMNGWDTSAALELGSDKKSASALLVVEAGQGFKIASADWAHEFNFDTITFNVAGFEKAADSNNIVASKAGVYMVNVSGLDTLEPTCTIDPVQLYVKGGMNGWAANADYALVYDKETDTATFTLEYADLSVEFKIAPDYWDLYNKHYNIGTLADGKYGYGTAEADAGNIKFTETGFYVIKVANVTTGEPVVTIEKGTGEVKPVVTPVPELYVKGAMNGWGAEDAYKLVVDAEADTATLEFVAVYGHEFKVANADWSFEFNAKTATLPEGLSGDGNIVVGATGLYKVVVSGLADKSKATCVITKVFSESSIADATAAEDGTKVIVAGTVKSITKWDAYNNYMNLTITDGTNDLYCYNMTGEASLGDMIVLYGEVGSYEGAKQLAKGATIVAKVAGANVIGLEQVTSVDQLKDGMQVVLAAKHYVMGAQNNKIRDRIELDADLATSVTNVEGLQVVTLVKSGDNWLLKVAEGQYLYYTGSSNEIYTGEVSDETAQWSIAITDGVLTITNVATSGDNLRYIQYNSSSPRFACYKNTQINPQLYIYPDVDAAGKVLSYSGTQNGHAHWNAEAGVFEMELDLKLWGRVSLNYDGTVLTTSTATVTGLFTTGSADWTYNLYTEGDGSTLFCSYNGDVRYYVTYNPTTNTINVALAGIHYKGTWEGQILANEDGEYVFTKEFAQWNRVALYYYGTELTVDNATFSGAIYGPGADWTEKLYYEDADKGLLLCGVTSKPTYQIVYNPKENTVVIDYYFPISSGSIVLNDITAAVETFTDKATLNSITGYESNFTFSDGVIVRVNDDKTEVTRLELNKNGDGVISFNTGSKITLSVTVKGTGGSNTCVFAVAVNGKYIVANEEAIAMECTAKDTTEAEQTAGVLYSYTESETVIDSKGNEKAGATAENMYATYGGEEVTVTFTIDASAISGGALVEILSPACIQGRGIGITAVSVAVAE